MSVFNSSESFFESIKGKVILVFLVASTALGGMWWMSSSTFDKILQTVDQLSEPNQRLQLINAIFRDVLLLEHIGDDLAEKSSKEVWTRFYQNSENLLTSLDSLAVLSQEEPEQVKRIDSIKVLLDQRTNSLYEFAKVRSLLVNNTDIKEKVESISGLISSKGEKTDGEFVKTEKRVTTTIYKEKAEDKKGESTPKEESKKGLFTRIFKGKKKEVPTSTTNGNVVVKREEVNVSVDTVAAAVADTIIQKVEEEVKKLATGQRTKTSRFVERERRLLKQEALIIDELLVVLNQVEQGVIQQNKKESEEARQKVKGSIMQIGCMIIGVLIISGLLVSLIFSDITRSNRYRKALLEAKEEAEYHSQAKQRFLSNMSHEIRTPLQSIIGYADLLSNRKQGIAEVEVIKKSSEHLLFLVNEILDYSRIISNQFEFSKQHFYLKEILSEVVQSMRAHAERKGLRLNFVYELPNELIVIGDVFRLKQIIYNLLGNAIKFTEKGKVDLSVTETTIEGTEYLQFNIIDSGIGMTEEQQQRIFNQFEQADMHIASKFGGAGLGLSIVKELVEGQEGFITVNSEYGQSTQFTVRLPKVEGNVTGLASHNGKGDLQVARITGEVWVVDDDDFIRNWIGELLKQLQVSYRLFESGEELLKASDEGKQVELFLVDMRMPGISGGDLCKAIRREFSATSKVVACTAMALPEERAAIRGLGYDDVLMKPFKIEELAAILGINDETMKNETIATIDNWSSDQSLDLSTLKQMTMGDEMLLAETLEQFAADTESDLVHWADRVDGTNIAGMAERVHKLAGRVGQIGAIPLSIELRTLEVKLRAGEEVDVHYLSSVKARIESLIKHLRR